MAQRRDRLGMTAWDSSPWDRSETARTTRRTARQTRAALVPEGEKRIKAKEKVWKTMEKYYDLTWEPDDQLVSDITPLMGVAIGEVEDRWPHFNRLLAFWVQKVINRMSETQAPTDIGTEKFDAKQRLLQFALAYAPDDDADDFDENFMTEAMAWVKNQYTSNNPVVLRTASIVASKLLEIASTLDNVKKWNLGGRQVTFQWNDSKKADRNRVKRFVDALTEYQKNPAPNYFWKPTGKSWTKNPEAYGRWGFDEGVPSTTWKPYAYTAPAMNLSDEQRANMTTLWNHYAGLGLPKEQVTRLVYKDMFSNEPPSRVTDSTDIWATDPGYYDLDDPNSIDYNYDPLSFAGQMMTADPQQPLIYEDQLGGIHRRGFKKGMRRGLRTVAEDPGLGWVDDRMPQRAPRRRPLPAVQAVGGGIGRLGRAETGQQEGGGQRVGQLVAEN